jgi:phage tail-like protein
MITQTSSLSSPATYPLRNFKFQLIFHPARGASVTMGVMTISGLGLTIDTIPYREGGYNTTVQNLPGQATFSPLTVTKGMMVGPQFQIAWIQQLFTVMQGTGSQKAGQDFRSTIDVLIIDHPVTVAKAPVKAAFTVYRAWPTAVQFSDLDAGANQLLISQMTLAHEGFTPSVAAAVGNSEATYGS